MSGCHTPPKDSGNTHPCIGCKMPVNKCFCIWDAFRTLSVMFSDLAGKIEKLEYEIEKLYKIKSDVGVVTMHYFQINEKINKLEENAKYNMSFEVKELLDGKLLRKPHKCPVCDGIGTIHMDYMCSQQDLLSGWKKDAMGIAYKDCGSCEGKGIVWG